MELTKLNIYLQGFDKKSIEKFESIFAQYNQDNFTIKSELAKTDIIIVDIDNLKSSQIVDELLIKQPNTPIIVFSLFIYCHLDAIVFSLKKPFNQKDFYKLLQQVALICVKNTSPVVELRKALLTHIQNNLNKSILNNKTKSEINLFSNNETAIDKTRLSTLVGRSSDIDIESPQAVMRVLFDSRNMLLGSIQRGISRAKHTNKMIELTNFGNRFIIDPSTNSLFSFISESVLRPLCLMSSKDISNIKVIKAGRNSEVFQALINDTNADIKEWSFEQFLWVIALWSSRGKLPRDIDLKLPVVLTHWPNLSRLQLFPNALEIAALMSQTPIRLTDIAAQLAIEQRYVFAFYTAANSIGLASNSYNQSDALFKNNLYEQPIMKNASVLAEEKLATPSSSIVKRLFNLLTKEKSEPLSSKTQLTQQKK